MRDLLLFRLLMDRAWDDPALPELLGGLAKPSLRDRVPYFGLLLELIAEGPKSLRPMALDALAGAEGFAAVRTIVSTLDDPSTRGSAVRALRRAAEAHPARWTHALFHPDPEVRLAATAEASPDQARHLELYLVSDELTRERVVARGLTNPRNVIAPLLDFARRKLLTPAIVRPLVTQAGLTEWLKSSRARSDAVTAEYLASASRDAGPLDSVLERQEDDLDDLFELFWPSDPKEDTFDKFVRGAYASLAETPARAACSMLRVARAHGGFCRGALTTLLRLHLPALTWEWIARGERERAAMGLFDFTDDVDLPESEILPLLWSPICTHPDGGPDLSMIGAVLSRLTEHSAPNETRRRGVAARLWVGEATLVATLTLRPEASVGFLFMAEQDNVDPIRLIKQIQSTRARRKLLTAFARGTPPVYFVLLELCEVLDVAAVAEALVTEKHTAVRADALAAVLVRKLGAEASMQALGPWRGARRSAGDPARAAEGDLASSMVFASAKEHTTEAWVAAVIASSALPFVLDLLDRETTFPYGKEMALAAALRGEQDAQGKLFGSLPTHATNAAIRAWAEKRTPAGPPPKIVPLTATTSEQERLVATCPLADLDKHLAPLSAGGARGVAALLARRTDHAPSVSACVALLASPDAIEETDAQLARYLSVDPRFLEDVETALVARFSHRTARLSPLGHAWLWRWERHAKAAFDDALARGDLGHAVREQSKLVTPIARMHSMAAIAHWLSLMVRRQRESFRALLTPEFFDALVLALPNVEGPWAAEVFATLVREREHVIALEALVPRVRFILADLPMETRARLSRWLDSEGLPVQRPTVARGVLSSDLAARVRGSNDLDELEQACKSPDTALVHEAGTRLLVLGESGRERLANVLELATSVADVRPLAESLSLWEEGPALDRARELMKSAAAAELRFRLALGFIERGEVNARAIAVSCALEPTAERWFETKDWERTLKNGGDEIALARALVTSSHPHAYLRAVSVVMASDVGQDAIDALRAFLETGTLRMGSLRRTAAAYLHARGDFWAFPLVMQQQLDDTKGASTLLVGASARLVEMTTLAFLAAGNVTAKEGTLLHHLEPSGIDPIALEDATAIVLTTATSDSIRQKVAGKLRGAFGMGRLRKLRRVADTFAWGVRTGRDLLGRMFRVQMTGGGSLGHTRLKESRIFVTPLPLLRGDQHGREIVEGLILHELGHHMYHRSAGAEKVWAEAEKEGLHGLLNLVADEHLERNLRAIDPEYGDRLKRLAAFAFQHTEREIVVDTLLGHLGGRAFEVLSTTRLGVAKDDTSVLVESGTLLSMMERQGLAFSRFVRALRMGLGNRHDDPRVARALTLFQGRFRHSEMKDLMKITRELKTIFGWETQLVESFGPHESLEASESDSLIWGEGITQDEVEREVQRVLDPRKSVDQPDSGKPGPPWINMAPKNEFDRITSIEKMPFDALEQARLAAAVQRPASIMRRYLEELGLALQPQRMRLSGFRIDRTRILPLVLRRDPRVLMARTKTNKTDLFLGITVDCSGSMASRDNMQRGKLFAALLAEAARGLKGVDLRVFGFTDKTIYDCGDANRCAAHALHSGGGNNDSAALFHLANVAKASRRKARVLVMISDGLPTECSVASLRELVSTLTRREHMVCAQAAVQPLAEVCFPHYVVLNDTSIEVTVGKFGNVIARLVQRAMTGG